MLSDVILRNLMLPACPECLTANKNQRTPRRVGLGALCLSICLIQRVLSSAPDSASAHGIPTERKVYLGAGYTAGGLEAVKPLR